ncbi:hypothetical protein Tco_0746285, partial [Tanacetum coccineum]
VDDLVPIPRESELTLDSPDLGCSMPIDSPCTDVLGDALVNIDLLLGEPLDTLSTEDREIEINPSRDIEELEHLLADDPVPVPRVFDDPLGNSDSISRSSETSDLFEELIAEIDLDDLIPIRTDDRYYDSEDDILFFEQLLNEDTSSDVSLALLPTKSSSLVLPFPILGRLSVMITDEIEEWCREFVLIKSLKTHHLLNLSTSTSSCDTEHYNVTPLSDSLPGPQPTTP